MGILDFMKGSRSDAGFIKNQMRSVIQWDNPDPNILVYKYTDRGDEIKNASKLIVAPGQGVVIVYEGKVQDIQTDPGTYDMATDNIPFITTVMKTMQAFESEHKVGIYFFKTTIITDQKWEQSHRLSTLTQHINFLLGCEHSGIFHFEFLILIIFFTNYIGTQNSVTIETVRSVVSDRIIAPMTDAFATAGIGYNEIDKNRLELSALVQAAAKDDFAPFGFELSDFRIENTDFDEDTQARIKTIADTQAQTIAAGAAGISYTDMQKLGALRDAAKNEGGAAGMFMGMNAGQTLGGVMNTPTAETPETRLVKAKSLLDGGLISQEEFDKKKSDILSSI